MYTPSSLKERASQVGTGVFLIGLALLFLLPGAQLWPHIMFVVAASLLATEYAEFKTLEFRRGRVVSAALCVVIGLIFAADFTLNLTSVWPIILILLGLFMIFNNRFTDGKRKNE